MEFWVLVFALSLLARLSSGGTPQCYFQIGTSADDPETLPYGTNSRSAVTLVIKLGYAAQFVTDSSSPFLQQRFNFASKAYTPALNAYQVLARHVLAHFQFKITEGANAGFLGIPFDPNRLTCSETCVRWYQSRAELRITSDIWNPYGPIFVEYFPPPLSHPTRFVILDGPTPGVLGIDNTFQYWTSPTVNNLPYITSMYMYNTPDTPQVIISFSKRVKPCAFGRPYASPWVTPNAGTFSAYGMISYTCNLGEASGSNGEVWIGNCPISPVPYTGYYVYGTWVNYMCDYATGNGLVSNSYEFPIERTRSWLVIPLIGNMPASSDISLCTLDWNLPMRRTFIYNITTKRPIRMVYRTPYPLILSTLTAPNGGVVNWGSTTTTTTAVSVPVGSWWFSNDFVGIQQQMAYGATFYPALGKDAIVNYWQTYVVNYTVVSIDSGSIYATLAMALYKWNDVNQNSQADPAYPTFVALSSTVIPSDKMKFTTYISSFAKTYPSVRYVSRVNSTQDIASLQVLDAWGVSVEHYFSAQYGTVGIDSALTTTFPKPTDASIAYLSCLADTTTPVFGNMVTMQKSTVDPSTVLYVPGKNTRVFFSQTSLTPVGIRNDRILTTCDSVTRAASSSTAYPAEIDFLVTIGCLDDPIVVNFIDGFADFRLTGLVSDAYATAATFTAQLPDWVPVAMGTSVVQVRQNRLTLTFNRTIFGVVNTGLTVACPSSTTGILTSAVITNVVALNTSLTATLSGCRYVPGLVFLTVKRYAIFFQPMTTGQPAVLPATIQSYPLTIVGNLSASFQPPTCSGSAVQIQVTPANDTSLGQPVNYTFVCDGVIKGSTNSAFGPGIVGLTIFQGSTACFFTATFTATGDSYTVPISSCSNTTVMVVDSHYEALESAVYVRFGTNLTINNATIIRSKFIVSCDNVSAVVGLVSVASPALVDRGTVLSPGPVLVLNVTGCSLDYRVGVLSLTIQSGAFLFANTETVQATVLMGPRYQPIYASRTCQSLNSSTIHMNTLTLNTAPVVTGFTHSPDGCVHVFQPAVSGASVVFYVQTITNRPCNTQLTLALKFGIPQTVYLSYGHCDDLPYFNLNPVVDYMFTGKINGKPYNADFGQYGSGGIQWLTSFAGLPNVGPETANYFGGLKDSVGVPGLNLTAYCFTDVPTVGSVSPPSELIRKKACVQNDELLDNWSNWTVVIAFDRQANRAISSNYNPQRPAGKYSLSSYRQGGCNANSDGYCIGEGVNLLSIGSVSSGKFSPLFSVDLYAQDTKHRSDFEIRVEWESTSIHDYAWFYFGNVPQTYGHLKLLLQRVCTSPGRCKSRILFVSATGVVIKGRATDSPALGAGDFADADIHFGECGYGHTPSQYPLVCYSTDIFSGGGIPFLANRAGLRIGGNFPSYQYSTVWMSYAGKTGCLDQVHQYIIQGISIYDRNLTDAEIDLVLRRKPPNGTVAVNPALPGSVLLGQHVKYNMSEQVSVYWYPTELPWLYNQTAVVPRYSLVIDGRNETTSFITAGTFSYTLTIEGHPTRSTDTVFSAGLKVNLIPREAPLSLQSLSLDLPAFLNVSLLKNVNVYQIAANTNRIKQITIFASPTNTSFFVSNGTTRKTFTPATRTGNYSVGNFSAGDDFIARWQFSGDLPSRVDVLGIDFTTFGATDQAVIIPNVLDPSVITLVLKTPIQLPSSTVYTAIEDTLNFLDIRPSFSYSTSGIAERCDSLILLDVPRNGTTQLVYKNDNTTAVTITPTMLPLRFNCTSQRLLYDPDLDFDRLDFFFIVYDCSITQSVPQNLTVPVTPVQDNPKTTTPLTGSVTVADPLVYEHPVFDVREVDTLDAWWSVDISFRKDDNAAVFFNKSTKEQLLGLLDENRPVWVNFKRGSPEGVNPRLVFEINRNRTLLTEIMLSVRLICGKVHHALMTIEIKDQYQFNTSTSLVFTRDIDCQVQTVGAAGDPDSPPGYGDSQPGGTGAAAVDNTLVLAINLVVWPVVGIAIVCGMYFVKNMFRRYKSVADSSLEAASALSKGDFKAAVSAGVKAARAY